MIRNIKEVNETQNSSSSKNKSTNDLYRNVATFLQRTSTVSLIQIVIVVIASGIILDKMVSSTSGYMPKKGEHVNSVARINFGDSFQQQQQIQEQQQIMLQNQHQQQMQQQQQMLRQPNLNDNNLGHNNPPNTNDNVERLKELERTEYERNANKDRIPKPSKSRASTEKSTPSKPQQTGFVPGPLYYNNGSPTPIPLKYEEHPAGGPAISILVTNREKDISELRTALRSLAFLQGDLDPNHKAPVLIFNEGDLSPEQIESIITSCPDRPISFPIVDFTEFPPGYNGEQEGNKFQVKGRKEWGYYHMIRFWVTG